jgi:hypothetical protein
MGDNEVSIQGSIRGYFAVDGEFVPLTDGAPEVRPTQTTPPVVESVTLAVRDVTSSVIAPGMSILLPL